MIVTLKEVRSYGPCHDPKKYRIHRARLSTILKHEKIFLRDKIWVACYVLAHRDREKLWKFIQFCMSQCADLKHPPLQCYCWHTDHMKEGVKPHRLARFAYCLSGATKCSDFYYRRVAEQIEKLMWIMGEG